MTNKNKIETYRSKVKNTLASEIYEFNVFNKSLPVEAGIFNLDKPILLKGVFMFIADWFIIFLCVYLSIKIPLLSFFGIAIVGSKQRALSNLVHDCSHYNLTRNKLLNDLLSDLFAGYAMISPVSTYRLFHMQHHNFLNCPLLDPDIKAHQNYNYFEGSPPSKRWYFNVLYLIFNLNSWYDSLFGYFKTASTILKIRIILWWITFFLLIILFSSLKYALFFFLFWQISKSTSYHIFRVLAEFLDHSGLPNGSISSSSRIIESNSLVFELLLHPHNDKYHAVHHFNPSIPNYNLARFNNSMSIFKNPVYSKIKKNCGYFVGPTAAVKDLVKTV